MHRQITFTPIVDALAQLERDERDALLSSFDSMVRNGTEADRNAATVTRPALARHLLYLAQSIGDDQREGATRGSAPHWETMVVRYAALRDSGAFLAELPEIKRDDLRNFCGLRHLRHGSRENHFHAALALFLLFEEEGGALDHAFFKELVPPSESDLPAIICEFLAHLLNEFMDSKGRVIPFPQVHSFPRRRDNPQVTMAFAYEPAEREKLDRFHNRFVAPGDAHIHLVLYRPRRSKPTQLIRSFLALSAPWNDRATGSRAVHNFIHVYRAPSDVGHEGRIGQGWALPLSQGLYLVGGQRPESVLWDPGVDDEDTGAARPPRIPFRSLDVLFFSWQALESNLPHGLMMTANKDGLPIITRVCALPTLVDHSKHVDLGEVAIDQLPDLLTQEWARERELAQRTEHGEDAPSLAVYAHFADVRVLAARIGDLCNNDPRAWEVPVGYRANKRRGGALTHAQVEHALNQAFGIATEAKFASTDRPFEFWTGLRFPPLSSG